MKWGAIIVASLAAWVLVGIVCWAGYQIYQTVHLMHLV